MADDRIAKAEQAARRALTGSRFEGDERAAIVEAIAHGIRAALADEQPEPEPPALPTEPGGVIWVDQLGNAFREVEVMAPPRLAQCTGSAWLVAGEGESLLPSLIEKWRPAEVNPAGTAAALAEARKTLDVIAAEISEPVGRWAQDALDRMHALDQGGAS